MKRFARYGLLSTTLLAMILLAMSIGQRLSHRAAARLSLDDWDLPEMADHLNRAGLPVRLQFGERNGSCPLRAYLTTTDKSWEDVKYLVRHRSRIQEWHGTVYCKRVAKDNPVAAAEVAHVWGDPCLAAGPFVFYGDAELLERIRAILVPFLAP